jgi:hypothetical protein
MKKLIENINKLILLIIALQILNLGLFAQNIPTAVSSASIDQNIINSITEYIAEVLLKKKDAFPENNNTTNYDKNTATFHYKVTSFNLFAETIVHPFLLINESNKNYCSLKEDNVIDCISEINPPPPKLAI